jgi:MSHA pilin protein MshD
MMTAEQNYRLLKEIEANRRFLLMAYRQNPQLLEHAEERVRELLEVPAQHGHGNLKPAGMAKQHGISLVELIMFIVIVGVALAGILLVMNVTTRNSADPLIHKQALAIAESMLEEVELMPFTYCDPDDSNAANATAATAVQCPAAGGVGGVEGMGPEPGETRYSSPQFDNVNDYDGCQMGAVSPGCDSTGTGGIRDITNNSIGPAAGYIASIGVTTQAFSGIAASEALLITVTVTGPDNIPVVLNGLRTRYSPRAVP